MCVIHFPGDRGNHLTLTIHGRKDSGTNVWHRGNLLRCTVAVIAGAFRGSMHAVIFNEDLARFLPQVEALAGQLNGAACFDSGDPSENTGSVCVSVYAKADGEGGKRFETWGHLCDGGGDDFNTLEFQWLVSEASLPPLAEQVRAALAAFPVIGPRLA